MADIFHRLPSYAFVPTPPLPDLEERTTDLLNRKGSRYFALFEDQCAAACAAITPMTQQVRGKLYPNYGVFDVVTAPPARRKGYARQILSHMFFEMREDQRPLSCLYPFRESFYERMGYVSFPHHRTARFSPAALLPLLKQNIEGEVELMLSGEGMDAYLACLRELRLEIHGMAVFDHPRRSRFEQNRQWLAIASIKGKIVGVMLYQMKGNGPTGFLMQISRFNYLNAGGKVSAFELAGPPCRPGRTGRTERFTSLRTAGNLAVGSVGQKRTLFDCSHGARDRCRRPQWHANRARPIFCPDSRSGLPVERRSLEF